MEEPGEDIKSLFMLKFGLESFFFKDFEQNFVIPQELNMTQIRVLVALSIHGPRSMSSLSKIILLEKGSFTPIAQKLTRLTYMEKVTDKSDKRRSLLTLTDKGEALANNYKKSHLVYVKEILSKLNNKELESYFNHIDAVNRVNVKLGLRPPEL